MTEISMGKESVRISASDVSVLAGNRRILSNVSFAIERCQVTALVGKNGAGKSTLLKVIAGQIRPETGSVTLRGDGAGSIGFVPQKPLALNMTVEENLRFVLRFNKNRALPSDGIEALLQEVELAHLARSPAKKLSGGETQRLAIARALACHPSILLLDEPTSAQDHLSLDALHAILLRVARSGVDVILSTHDFGFAKRLCDEILLLEGGCLRSQTPNRQFFSNQHSLPEALEA